MTASAAFPGPGWAWVLGVVVFVAVLAVLAADRVRLTRRCAARERDAALLRTDLADARRELDALRDCLRGRSPAVDDRGTQDAADPNTPVG